MNYFRLKLTTEWCGMDNERYIMTPLTMEELEEKYCAEFDEVSVDNLTSFMSEEEVNEEGYEIGEACSWYLEELEDDDYFETFTLYI